MLAVSKSSFFQVVRVTTGMCSLMTAPWQTTHFFQAFTILTISTSDVPLRLIHNLIMFDCLFSGGASHDMDLQFDDGALAANPLLSGALAEAGGGLKLVDAPDKVKQIDVNYSTVCQSETESVSACVLHFLSVFMRCFTGEPGRDRLLRQGVQGSC